MERGCASTRQLAPMLTPPLTCPIHGRRRGSIDIQVPDRGPMSLRLPSFVDQLDEELTLSPANGEAWHRKRPISGGAVMRGRDAAPPTQW